MSTTRRQWNLPNITSEQFDDEVVVVNFESGKYHSIQGDGVTIWQWLERRLTIDQTIALALDRFEGGPTEIAESVRAFIADLERERLVVPVSSESEALPTSEGEAARTSFRPSCPRHSSFDASIRPTRRGSWPGMSPRSEGWRSPRFGGGKRAVDEPEAPVDRRKSPDARS